MAPHGNQVEKVTESKLERRLVQAVVSPHSRLVGVSVRDNRFRTRFNAAIIGVHRQGERVKEKIGDIVLGGGDVLLLDTGPQFVEQHRNDRNFALVSEVENSTPPRYVISFCQFRVGDKLFHFCIFRRCLMCCVMDSFSTIAVWHVDLSERLSQLSF